MAHYIFFIFVFFFLALPPSVAAETSLIAAETHHDLHIVIDPRHSAIEGVDSLTLQSEGGPLHLLLASQSQIEDVRIIGLPTVRYRFSGGILTVFLPTTTAGRMTLRVAYRAIFDDPVPEDPVHDEDPSYGVSATIFETGVFLGSGAHWHPVIPGRPFSYRLHIESPDGMEAVTSGRLVERGQADGKSYSIWESSAPLNALTVAAGPYRIDEGKLGTISIYTYLYPENAHLSKSYLEASKGYLKLFQELFGPYPYRKFAVAENFFPTGYGFPSWTLLGSSVVHLPFIVETSLGHEIAHSWWGNGVLVDPADGNWSEGLTTYVADHLFKERESKDAAREYRLKILREYTALVAPEKDYPLSEFISRESATDQSIGYGKAAMVFHMARKKLGDTAFWAGLQAMVDSHLHRKASWSDFSRTWRTVSTTNLDPFFRQWVARPGAPVLSLAEVAIEKNANHWLIRGRLEQLPPYFNLNIPLRLETSDGPMERIIPLHGKTAQFDLASRAKPLRLVVDPEVDLFRRLHPEEMPTTVNSLRGSKGLLTVVSEDLPDEILDRARELLKSLRHPQSRLVRERELSARDLAGYDLLFLGWPTDVSLRPPLPKAVQMTPPGFTIDGERFDSQGAALFAALPHPVDPARGSALFLPLSAAAAKTAVRKIPHYGKYSYLVFDSGENRIKGIWPTTSSPLLYDFVPKEHPQ